MAICQNELGQYEVYIGGEMIARVKTLGEAEWEESRQLKLRATDYTRLVGSELNKVCGDDAQKWAEAFVQICKDPSDVDLVFGWFANAIETACDQRTGNNTTMFPNGSTYFIAEKGQ